jgi:hypothetical protein
MPFSRSPRSFSASRAIRSRRSRCCGSRARLGELGDALEPLDLRQLNARLARGLRDHRSRGQGSACEHDERRDGDRRERMERAQHRGTHARRVGLRERARRRRHDHGAEVVVIAAAWKRDRRGDGLLALESVV